MSSESVDRLSDLVPKPYSEHELVAHPSERMYVRSLDDERNVCTDWTDAASHVLSISIEYMLKTRFFTPQIAGVRLLLPIGDVRHRRRAVDDFYEILREETVPPKVLNHDPSIGPRYVEGVEGGERVATVNARPADTILSPNRRVRTTPIGAVQLLVQVAEGDETIGEVLTHYDDAIVRRTDEVSLAALRLVDQDTGAHYGLLTDSSVPCVTEPVNAPGPNHLDLC
ncbi:hypothetical protein [Haloferax sp. YSSS75]|uniref:hypothetical protein n=1 Tax=Haloferax sp. YSSS75 TaxID=3388564 RepID=UPI00398CA93A